MHIHEASAGAYCTALAQSLARDARSFEYWFLLHGKFAPMTAEAWAEFRTQCIHEVREKFAGVTVDIVFSAPQEVLLVSRDLDPKSLGNLARILGVERDTIYPIYAQAEAVLNLLKPRATEPPEGLSLPHYAAAEYPEISTLSEVFVTASEKRINRQPLHVLIVEDDPLTLRMVSSLMQKEHAVFTAKDAEDAIAQYMTHAPDIVFLDIGLPGTNGFEVLRHIRRIDPYAYVVMFSGNRNLEHICHALNMGASGFIGKPFRKESMSHYLAACASRSIENPLGLYAH